MGVGCRTKITEKAALRFVPRQQYLGEHDLNGQEILRLVNGRLHSAIVAMGATSSKQLRREIIKTKNYELLVCPRVLGP